MELLLYLTDCMYRRPFWTCPSLRLRSSTVLLDIQGLRVTANSLWHYLGILCTFLHVAIPISLHATILWINFVFSLPFCSVSSLPTPPSTLLHAWATYKMHLPSFCSLSLCSLIKSLSDCCLVAATMAGGGGGGGTPAAQQREERRSRRRTNNMPQVQQHTVIHKYIYLYTVNRQFFVFIYFRMSASIQKFKPRKFFNSNFLKTVR